MRGFASVLALTMIAIGASSAFAADKIRLAQSSAVTNCIMTCNAQAAACQTTCVLPGPPPSASTGATPPTTTNATANIACTLNCGIVQLSCQTNCGLRSSLQ